MPSILNIYLSLSLVLLTHLFGSIPAKAQVFDSFNQQYATIIQSFPEFAGWHGGVQLNAATRLQWVGLENYPETQYFSADGYLDKVKTAIGIYGQHDALGQLKANQLGFCVSPKLSISEKLVLMPAVGVRKESVSLGNIYPSPGYVGYPYDNTEIGAGVGFVKGSLFGAAHADYSDYEYYHVYYRFIAGQTFSIRQFNITPSLTFGFNRVAGFATASINAQYKKLYAGTSYHHNSNINFAVGYEFLDVIRLSYNFEIYTSVIQGSNGTHELAIRVWLFKDKAKRQFISNLPIL